ncbi:unnamed protein product, partial [Brassica rapa]
GLCGGVGNLARWPGSCGFVSFLKGCRLWLLRGCSLPTSLRISLLCLSPQPPGSTAVWLLERCLLVCHVCSSPFVRRLASLVSCYLSYGSRVAASIVRLRTRP